MHERLKYQKRPWYPGLQERDTILWNRFIEKYPDAYDEVIYNLHIGQGAPIPKDTPPEIAKDYILLTQWKIDVVGFKGDEVHIIELKPYAGASAIGQVMAYLEMYKGYIDPEAEPKPVIVTDQLRPDVALLAARLGFRVFIV